MADHADTPLERDRLLGALPPGHGHRGRISRAGGRLADLALDARQSAMGVSRELDRHAEERPARRVLVLGIYGPDGAEQIASAAELLAASRHEVTVVLGSIGEADPRLAGLTAQTRMSGGKFQNLNRLAEVAAPLAYDWTILLDDDIVVPGRATDRMIGAAELLRLDLAQPALTRASHGVWDINRRRPAMARQTAFVEIGPLVLIARRLWKELTPFPELGMGWGLCLHWAALARRHGWRLGVIDAVPVRHEQRPPALSYKRDDAREAALEFLASHEHLHHSEAERVIATHAGIS